MKKTRERILNLVLSEFLSTWTKLIIPCNKINVHNLSKLNTHKFSHTPKEKREKPLPEDSIPKKKISNLPAFNLA